MSTGKRWLGLGAPISGLHTIPDHHESHTFLKRNVLLGEIGAMVAFLVFDSAAAITLQIFYASCSYSVMGM